MPSSVATVLGAEGPIAAQLSGFAPREQQLTLASAVEVALQHGDTLIAEAGTGVGKTFAYLIPAMLSDARVVISTGTKHLQDQLFHRDLPLVRKALQLDMQAALLKGRSNYLCTHRLGLSAGSPQLRYATTQQDYQQIKRWAARTQSGDINEVSDVSEDSKVWPLVTSTTENCLGIDCPDYRECFVLKARREAQNAKLIVVNHHLLFADLALKEEGFGEVLPEADAYILDEAHQLPETAAMFFGDRFSSRQIQHLVQDTIAEQLKEAAEDKSLRDLAETLQKASRNFRLSFGVSNRKAAWRELGDNQQINENLQSLALTLDELATALDHAKVCGAGLENCAKRALAMQSFLAGFVTGLEDAAQITWFETFNAGYTLNTTPIDIAPLFRGFLEARPGAWIFTSATLAVASSFKHFRARMGLDEAEELCLSSPFDYANNALLYLPPGLPEPNSQGYLQTLITSMVPVIKAAQGRTFVLFTSHRALRETADLLPTLIDFPILVQGESSKREILQKFRELGNAVLLGTSSFWEGVDVRGEALSCVVIDKLPFASPGDPVLQAKLESIRQQGKVPFMDYQLPQAVIALKQGAGRLIRDVQDRGVLMLCDPRLSSKPYGKLFLKSLPEFNLTRELDDVTSFFEQVPEDNNQEMPKISDQA